MRGGTILGHQALFHQALYCLSGMVKFRSHPSTRLGRQGSGDKARATRLGRQGSGDKARATRLGRQGSGDKARATSSGMHRGRLHRTGVMVAMGFTDWEPASVSRGARDGFVAENTEGLVGPTAGRGGAVSTPRGQRAQRACLGQNISAPLCWEKANSQHRFPGEGKNEKALDVQAGQAYLQWQCSGDPPPSFSPQRESRARSHIQVPGATQEWSTRDRSARLRGEAPCVS